MLWGCFLIPNFPSTSRIVADVLEGQPPLSIRFDGTTSDDEDGIVSSYRWAFGDGMMSETMRSTHTFTFSCEYPERSLGDMFGKIYDLAETAVSGKYLVLGAYPWGIDQKDIHNIWDAGDPAQ